MLTNALFISAIVPACPDELVLPTLSWLSLLLICPFRLWPLFLSLSLSYSSSLSSFRSVLLLPSHSLCLTLISFIFFCFTISLSLLLSLAVFLSFPFSLALSPRYFPFPTLLRAPAVKVDSKAGEFSVDSKTSLRHSPFQLLRNRRKSGTNTKVKFLRKLPQKLKKTRRFWRALRLNLSRRWVGPAYLENLLYKTNS